MRKNSHSKESIKEAAIDKASQLISLLQKENRQASKKVNEYEKQLKIMHFQFDELTQKYQANCKQLEKYKQQLIDTSQKLQKQLEKSKQTEEILKRKISSNKELHEKISILTAKLKEKTKSTSQDRAKFLSLQNQNEYLLKKLGEYQRLQSVNIKSINESYKKCKEQLQQALKLKQAFSRRCQQLKLDNFQLIDAAAKYKELAINKENKQSNKQQIQKDINRKSIAKFQILSDILAHQLGVTPESTIQEQARQISSFVEYRLSHIDSLIGQIAQKCQFSQWKRVENLKDIEFMCNRVSLYVGELICKSS